MSSPPSTYTTEPANLHWSRQDTVRLIDLYRHYPCLWNVKSDMYKDRDKRAAALKGIAEEIMKITASITTRDIKRKIETLRNQYRREMRLVHKSQKLGAGTDEIYRPKLWCFNDLSFLNDSDTIRASVSNMDAGTNHTTEDVATEEAESSSDVNSNPGTTLDADDPVAQPSSFTCSSAARPIGGPKKRKRQDACDNILSLIGERLQSSRQDEFDIIGKNVNNKLRRLSREQQLFAERLINDVLFEGGLANLNRNSKIAI
ncbi:uncharacterized protein LOC121876281 isoform X2 [Homarus americanus]|uniref:uncharacterized protein LOC121876281 isoform X2 n=1 Tax=Homarus americanus TaxID=6706 RepID=UPI001C4740F5|nr:uncharacterized protein LOC121876281 isoform X2 [Homarus americanus]